MSPYIYGGAALDLLLGVERAERVEVFVGTPPLMITYIREAFPIIGDRPVDGVLSEPGACCRACDAVVTLDGKVTDRLTGQAWADGPLSLSLEADLTLEAALRHSKLIDAYPEVPIDPVSLRLIRAKVAFASARLIGDAARYPSVVPPGAEL